MFATYPEKRRGQPKWSRCDCLVRDGKFSSLPPAPTCLSGPRIPICHASELTFFIAPLTSSPESFCDPLFWARSLCIGLVFSCFVEYSEILWIRNWGFWIIPESCEVSGVTISTNGQSQLNGGSRADCKSYYFFTSVIDSISERSEFHFSAINFASQNAFSDLYQTNVLIRRQPGN